MEQPESSKPAEASSPDANGDVEMHDVDNTGSSDTNAQRPPLGRHASVGDKQLTLGNRQISDAVQGGQAATPKAAVPSTNGDKPTAPSQPENANGFSTVVTAETSTSISTTPAAPTPAEPPKPAPSVEAPLSLPVGVPPTQQPPVWPTGVPLHKPVESQVPSPASVPTSIPAVSATPVNLAVPAAAAAAAPVPKDSPAISAPAATLPPAAAAVPKTQPPLAPEPAQPAPPPAMAAPAAQPPGPPGMKELKVEDALLYLDDVKREFGDRPRIYNEFLAIMKNFKCQEVDTNGVIARVSKLFRGYNNLILGFNKFLPDGYKISLKDLEEADAMYAREQEELRKQAALAAAAPRNPALPPTAPGLPAGAPPGLVQLAPVRSQPPTAPIPGARPPMPPAADGVRRPPIDSVEHHPPPVVAQPPPSASFSAGASALPFPPRGAPAAPVPPSQPPAPPQARAPAQQAPQQAVEFDHAISYVTTIKRRFANDPSIYHSFLEILHTYQKEQRGIKEVLENVAHLFQDHPDLLKEFTFFLPDAVQDQAKERLHRAAADSEARQAARRALEQQKQEKQVKMDVDQSSSSHKLIDMTGKKAVEAEAIRGKKRAHTEAEAPRPVEVPPQPESYVYNSAVERQFFDAAREALAAYTRDGGQAWSEFLKCLDMYAQEILSHSEMLNFVEPLLGKRNNKLFEEFKRIIACAGGSQVSNAPNMEDSWYSVPLSEIDFSRCRRCSPSYRALPRDYPLPPTSERRVEDMKVLNDVWVSLPVGSEESYTFRHMRRNICEEVLFRCEDERFEIDMAIDSNATTLARLEPIAEEIAQLAESELLESGKSLDGGLAGKKFQYVFDKSTLSIVHRNSITRIYGDAGQEMLDLMVKNPTVAIPLIVERLRQKDQEWRKVRPRLNRRWKELAEHNYYGSLDHRGLTWRTTDKRAISTRTLVAEIKDRAAHNGREGPAAFQARLDKAKEEHGGFFETTMGKSLNRDLDLTKLPKPDRRLFTPHMSLMYENTSWVYRDAYRLISFALERGSTSPADKEKCHRLWFHFLGPWFNLDIDWMTKPAVAFQETTAPIRSGELSRTLRAVDEQMEEDDDESGDEDGEMATRVVTEDVHQTNHNDKHDKPSYMDHHPLPAGATVSTAYGDGRIIECRQSDDMYVVLLPFGKAYLRPSAVLCSIVPPESNPLTDQLRSDDRTKLDRRGDMLAIGTQSLYLFFRLHQILVRRLGIAKKLAYSVREDRTLVNMVEQMPGEDAAALGRRRYDAFISLIYSLLDGHTMTGNHSDGGKYEERVRSLLGHGSYELATMDKLISHLLKNLQSISNDDTMWNMVQLYRRHLAAGSFKPEAFRLEAGRLADGEQMYAFQMCSVQKDGGDKSVLHIEYLGAITESGEKVAVEVPVETTNPHKRHKKDR
eukprot:Nitzschia sp. Nitz4//scaffold6_size259037//239398//243609//NITZ4_001126-RA/size259037-processed-gene-0.97-mRNA-1//-1//CDS//3329557049//3640//frame0